MHSLYNPEGITQYIIVPGLMGVILTMTLVLMTGLAITRERERGTMENLLAMPLRPLEVMSGKIVPYVVIGLIQITIILSAARFMFHVPFEGSLVDFLLRGAALHRRQPDRRHYTVLAGAEPAAGHAADDVLFPAEHTAFGLHVSVPGHARRGRASSARRCP